MNASRGAAHRFTRILAFAAVWLALAAAGCALHENLRSTDSGAASAPAGQITVVSFNIRHGCGVVDWGNTSSQFFRTCAKQLDAIAATIRSMQPDLAALQEVDDGQARVLAQRTGLNYAYASHNTGGYGAWWGNAVLSRFPILASGVAAVGGTGGRSRSVVHATVDFGGRPLTIVSVHTDHRQRDEGAVQRILSLARELPAPVLLVGDFNMTPEDARVRLLTDGAGMADTAAAAGRGDLGTYAGRRIDYVFAPRTHFRVLGAALAADVHQDASDHRAYVTNLRVLP